MMIDSKIVLVAVILCSIGIESAAFSVGPKWCRRTSALFSSTSKSQRPRSRVTDPSGPSPDVEENEIETIKLEDIPGLKYDPDAHPIPHQPWRRGVTAGCEDPIDAEWRQKAEQVVKHGIETVGGTFIDITWFLTHVVVTIDDQWDRIPRDYLNSNRPVIEIHEPESPLYHDPSDPNPEDIWDDDDDVVYQRDDEAEQDIRSKMYAREEEDDEPLGLDEREEPSMYVEQETREDDALRIAEEAELLSESRETPVSHESLMIDSNAVSLVAGAIVEALETVEDELKVLERHELILSSPGPPDILETQSQFDAHRGYDVAVETQDPWESNRTIRGKLVDRNSMDVIINKKGRMVTIPLNFVKCVILPHAKRIREDQVEEAEDASDDEDIYED